MARKKRLDFEGNTKREGEGSLYDKIMRENLLEIFLPLVLEHIQVKVKKITPMPNKQPTTVLRESDAFLTIETYSKEMPKFILHIEFERGNNSNIVYRIAEYHGIQLRKHGLPVAHVVVYLGEEKPTMKTRLDKSEVFEGFTLINAHDFSVDRWLQEDEPARIIMAILGDYKKENAKIILEAIMNKLRRVCKSKADLKKFVEQLIIISRMRNLEKLTIEISKAMPVLIDIEKDYLYNLGKSSMEQQLEEAKADVKEAKAYAKAAQLEAQIAKVEADAARLKAEAAIAQAETATAQAETATAQAETAVAQAETAVAQAKAEAIAETATAQAEATKNVIKNIMKSMKSNNKYSDEDIMDALNLTEEQLAQYLVEITAEGKKEE